MASQKEVAQYWEKLSGAPLFAGFDESSFEVLIDACEVEILAPPEALWAVGSTGEAAYILVQGRIELTRRLPPDGQRVDQINSPGSALGLSSLVKPWEVQSAATALERTELLRLDRSSFRELFDAGEMAAYRLVDALAQELVEEMRDANRRLHEVFGNPAETLRTLRRRVRGA